MTAQCWCSQRSHYFYFTPEENSAPRALVLATWKLVEPRFKPRQCRTHAISPYTRVSRVRKTGCKVSWYSRNFTAIHIYSYIYSRGYESNIIQWVFPEFWSLSLDILVPCFPLVAVNIQQMVTPHVSHYFIMLDPPVQWIAWLCCLQKA
jgi:hypothetical protein